MNTKELAHNLVTIRDVAKAAGVSVATVSIVMNDKSRERSIPEATHEKVSRIMRELGYQPNLSARRLRSGYKNIPVVVFFWPLDFRITILASFLNAFAGAVQSQEFDCELVVRTYDSGKLDAFDNIIMRSGYNGIIVGACTLEDIAHLEELNPLAPVVLINRESQKFSTVSIDNDSVGHLAAEEFIRKGHRSAAVFASNTGYLASNMRVNAFVKYCRESNIMIRDEHILRDNSTFDGGYCLAENFLAMNDTPRAIFCDSDSIALGALKALKDKAVNVPDDLEILTVDMNVSGNTAYSMPSLSVIEMPNEVIGHEVMRVLNSQINTKNSQAAHVKVAPKLITRESM